MITPVLRLYLGRFFLSFSNWLSFFTIAFLVQDQFGAWKVTWLFLAQNISGLFLSRFWGRIIPDRSQLKVYISVEFIQALLVISLIFIQSFWFICFYIVVASVLSSITSPISIALIGKWVLPLDFEKIHTRVAAIGATTLAIVPAMGAWILEKTNYSVLFGFSAGSFLLAGIVFMGVSKVESLSSPSREISHRNLKFVPALYQGILLWAIFLIMGAVLNGIEFSIFAERQLTHQDIGWIISAWGIGNLLTFLLSHRSISEVQTALFFAVALIGFFLFRSVVSLAICFLIAGYFYAVLTGFLRGRITRSIPEDVKSISIWAMIQQHLAVINILIYGLIALLLPWVPLAFFAGSLVVMSLILAFLIRRPVYNILN